ncbi:MAG: hypothetical protein ACYS21_16615 [Planctomycetota bacterium]|jgi:hypothetical protein
MAAFTATDWSVTVQRTWIAGPTRHSRCKLTATVGSTISGADALLPLPTAGKLGMKRNVDYVIITSGLLATNGDRLVDYDQVNHKLKVFSGTATVDNPIQETASATAITGTIYIEAVGW